MTGIPEEAGSGIFDPFFITKEAGKGRGMGLTTAHSIVVEKSDGTIAFETETGKGTTFIIRMPLGLNEVKGEEFPYKMPSKVDTGRC